MKKLMLAVVSAALAAGCVATQPQVWRRTEPYTQEDFARQDGECRSRASAAHASCTGGAGSCLASWYDVYNACMRAGGWYLANQ